ncbi:MAG: DUF4340 domain-containing protein [Cyclobacteriaceae bacterium]|nr:DUF4340 domain-containing protein [Cyclobacteriaceae bacterium]
MTITFAVLVAAGIGLLLAGRDRGEINKSLFKIEDLQSVNKITFTSPRGSFDLSYDGVRWKVGQYDADDQLVTVLFATLQQVEPKRMVSANQRDEIADLAEKQGTTLQLLNETVLIRQLTVVGNDRKSETYFLDPKTEPYVMVIPGYRVYVGGVFEVGELGWREKRIFNFNWRNFKKLEARYPGQPENGFAIEDNGSGFDIVGAVETDTTRLNDYLDAVSLLVAKEILPKDNASYDTLSERQPTASVLIYDVGDNVRTLDLFAPSREASEVVGRTGENEFVLFDRAQILPIVKTREYFKEKSR